MTTQDKLNALDAAGEALAALGETHSSKGE